jgi:hypothetical protein
VNSGSYTREPYPPTARGCVCSRRAHLVRRCALQVDGLLLGIFVLFGSEFVLNCLARDDYTLSFFFWMDLIGTLSIVADISWMAQDLGLADADENTLKASRAARVGGKAGRLTRVLKVRMLPLSLSAPHSHSPRAMQDKHTAWPHGIYMGVRHGPRGQVVRLLKLVFHFIFNPTKHNTDTLASSGEAPSKIGQSLTEAISYQVRPRRIMPPCAPHAPLAWSPRVRRGIWSARTRRGGAVEPRLWLDR